jgi:hypothetical protein
MKELARSLDNREIFHIIPWLAENGNSMEGIPKINFYQPLTIEMDCAKICSPQARTKISHNADQ